MSTEEKLKLVILENSVGMFLVAEEGVVQRVMTLWVGNLRRRLVVFQSYLGVATPKAISMDWNAAGSWAFLFAGLVPSMIAAVSRTLRTSIVERESIPISYGRNIVLFENSKIPRRIRQAW